MQCSVSFCEASASLGMVHFVLNVLTLILIVVRYLWGPLNDLTRLGLVVMVTWMVGNDLEFYFNWHYDFLSFWTGTTSEKQIIARSIFLVFLIADLVRDYMRWRFNHYMRSLLSYVRGSEAKSSGS